MKEKPTADARYFRKRLAAFIQERHPQLVHARALIDTRSRQAAEVYAEAVERGANPLTASAQADAVLYEGLIFSRYDTLRCILATEYPDIPTKQQRALALDIEPHCEEVFSRFNLDDDLIGRSEYNHLILMLINVVRSYFAHNHILLRLQGRPRRRE